MGKQTNNAGPVLTIMNTFCEIYANRVILPDQCRNQLQKKTVVPLQERQFLWSTQDFSVCAVERKEMLSFHQGFRQTPATSGNQQSQWRLLPGAGTGERTLHDA